MICPKCGFSYLPEISENVKRHDDYHDKMVNEIQALETKEAQIVQQFGDSLISVVNSSSALSQKKIAEKVGIIAHRDTPYDRSPYSASEIKNERDVHVFLYHEENRIIGFLLVEKRKNIWSCSWEQFDRNQASKVKDIPFLWAIGLVWVNRRYRRKGIAKSLIKEASNYFNLKIKDFGWYAPPITESGEAMLRKILPEGYFIAN